jgi:hypothetical protein
LTNLDYSKNKQQYISNLYDDFKRAVSSYLSMIEYFLVQPQTTDADKRALEEYKTMLKGKDVREVEESFLDGDIVKALDKIAKFYKDLSDYALEHINKSQIWKQVVRQVTHQHIEDNKNYAKKCLEELQILH